ncbi:hypothetical protein RCL1_008980 [Eukaryota sp. TZLM3-RCL]
MSLRPSVALLNTPTTHELNDKDLIEVRSLRRRQQIKDFLEMLAWNAASFLIFYYTNTWQKIRSGNVVQPYFFISLFSALLFFIASVGLKVYGVYIKKENPKIVLDKRPKFLYSLAAVGTICVLFFFVGVWSIYKWLTIPVTFVYLVAIITLSKYIPL